MVETAAPEEDVMVVTADSENGGEVAATETGGKVPIERIMAGHIEEADPDGMLDTVTDETMICDIEPDINLLDIPEGQI